MPKVEMVELTVYFGTKETDFGYEIRAAKSRSTLPRDAEFFTPRKVGIGPKTVMLLEQFLAKIKDAYGKNKVTICVNKSNGIRRDELCPPPT